jgi:hypothetical protein
MATKGDCIREHEFVLVLSGVSELGPEVTDALFEAGCDDATPSVRSGRVYLTFTREASSFKEAIISAIRDVKRSRIGVEVLNVDDCNLVSQSEIARRISRTRQQVGQYVSGTRGPGDFPPPVYGLKEGRPLWDWCDVLSWLYRNRIVDRAVYDASMTVAGINAVLEFVRQGRIDSSLIEVLYPLVADVAK